jgi:hypothetical protein
MVVWQYYAKLVNQTLGSENSVWYAALSDYL